MTDLSPAAQAVLTAQAQERCLFEWSAVNNPPCHPNDPSWNGCVHCIDRRGIAAALRAVAEQVVPVLTTAEGARIYDLIEAIAAELEAQQ
jgi:hypothetical protein